MLEAPDADGLLAIARQTLVEEVLPALPEESRLAARMIANALAIAGRAIAAERGWMAEAGAGIQALCGGDAARLSQAIRAGDFDPGTERHAEAAALLARIARARCAVSAPRALG